MPIDIADVAEVIYFTDDSSSPLTIVKPAAFSSGEMLLFVHSQDAGSASDLTAPAVGWTIQGSYDNVPANSACKVWSHLYNASDPGTWDFGYNAGASTVGVLVRITGADLTPTIVVSSFVGNVVSGTIDSPSVTPTGINDLLLCVVGEVCAGGAPFSKTDPSGMTSRGSGQFADLWNALGLASQQLSSGNSTGAKTWTAVSPNSAGGSLSIAVKSSGFLDPDPPPNPPPAIVPPWMLRELIGRKQQPVRGDQGTPVVKERLSGGASGANVTLVTGAATAAGDILVAFHGNNFYTAAQLLTPTGTAGTWSLATTGDNGSNSAHLKIWTRKVTVDGAQTVTVAPAVDEEHSIHLFVVSGADQTTWVDVAAGSNGASSTSHIAPTVDPTVFNALLLVGAQSTSLGNYTIPSTLGMAKQMEVDVGGFCTSATSAEVLGNDAPTGTRTFTLTAAGAYASASIALRPVQDVVTGGGGTTFPVSVAGGMTPSGVLARQPNRLLAGTGTSSGVVQRQPQKTLTGVLTPAGVMQRVTGKLLGGALAPAGALATIRLRVLAFAGGLTPTGALARQTSKLMAGGFTPAGSLIRQVGKALAGAATPAGTLANIRSRLISLAGSLSPTATLVRQTNKPLAGAESPTGALIRQTAKHPTGAITPSGVASLIRSRLLAIAGALTPSGQLARTPGKATAGAITPAATMARVVGKRTSGALTPAGVVTLVRNRVLALVGVLTPSGSLTRRPARSVTGSMTSSGVVTRRVGKSASGGLGLTGAVLKLVGKLLGGSEAPSGDVLIVDNPVVIAWPPSADPPVVSRRFTAGQPTTTAAATAGAPRVTYVAAADPPIVM